VNAEKTLNYTFENVAVHLLRKDCNSPIMKKLSESKIWRITASHPEYFVQSFIQD
jgi:hypothetical protein